MSCWKAPLLVLGFVAVFNPAGEAFADALGTPRATVEAFQESLADVMNRAPELGAKGRHDALSQAIGATFDIKVMARTVTRPHWESATQEQRARLVAASHRMMAATVAALFGHQERATFSILRERKTNGRVVLVDAQVNRPAKKPMAVTYVAAPSERRWRLVDVVFDHGISELATRKSEYRGLLASGGIEKLIVAGAAG
jgi:phospholipid transport system substrate-binding protein